MKAMVRCLLVLVVGIVLAAPAYSAPPAKPAAQAKPAAPAQSAAADSPDDDVEVMHVFVCDMSPGVTEAQVDEMAQTKFKAIRQMPGGEKATVHILWPAAVSKMGTTDFQIVWTFPSFSDWGKLWDAYTDASPLAREDDATEGKVQCPDSMLWESHKVELPK